MCSECEVCTNSDLPDLALVADSGAVHSAEVEGGVGPRVAEVHPSAADSDDDHRNTLLTYNKTLRL